MKEQKDNKELVKKDNDLDDETRNLVDAIIEKNEAWMLILIF